MNRHIFLVLEVTFSNFTCYPGGEVGETLGFSFCPGNLSAVLLGQRRSSEMAGDNVWFSLLQVDLSSKKTEFPN